MRRRGIFGPVRGPGRQFIDEELIIAHAHFEAGRFADAGVTFEKNCPARSIAQRSARFRAFSCKPGALFCMQAISSTAWPCWKKATIYSFNTVGRKSFH